MDKKSILYVEDDELVQEVVQDILDDEGHKLTLACNVDEAIEILKKDRFDLVLLDYTLKEGTSEGIIHYMKADSIYQSTPIIVMSGDLNNNIAVMLRSSIDAILVKPVNADKLISAIDSYARPRQF